MINECFGVAVTSAAMDGAAPEIEPRTGSLRDKQQLRSTLSTTYTASSTYTPSAIKQILSNAKTSAIAHKRYH